MAGAGAVLLFVLAGCGKEELMPPAGLAGTPTKVEKAGGARGDTVIVKPFHGTSAPISDDGDDLGDKESRGRPGR